MKSITELGYVFYISRTKTKRKSLGDGTREYYMVYSLQNYRIKTWRNIGGGLYIQDL